MVMLVEKHQGCESCSFPTAWAQITTKCHSRAQSNVNRKKKRKTNTILGNQQICSALIGLWMLPCKCSPCRYFTETIKHNINTDFSLTLIGFRLVFMRLDHSVFSKKHLTYLKFCTDSQTRRPVYHLKSHIRWQMLSFTHAQPQIPVYCNNSTSFSRQFCLEIWYLDISGTFPWTSKRPSYNFLF